VKAIQEDEKLEKLDEAPIITDIKIEDEE